MKGANLSRAYRQQVEKLMADLGHGVEEIYSHDRWGDALRFLSKFYTYSWFNAMLIGMQCPSASLVAGYQAWKVKGRHVRRGERSIKIMAPRTATVQDPKTGEEEEVVTGFRTVSVFDLSQTDGAPVPEFPEWTRPVGGGAKARSFYSRLKKIIPVPVLEGDTGTADGFYDVKAKQITIKKDLPMGAKAITLIHEYTHALLHNDLPHRSMLKYYEAVAEGVAYIVARFFELDPGMSSFEYIALWSLDKDLIWTVGPQIQKTAAKIIRQLLAAEVEKPKVPRRSAMTRLAAMAAAAPMSGHAPEPWVTVYGSEDREDAEAVSLTFTIYGIEAGLVKKTPGYGVEVQRKDRDRAKRLLRERLFADEEDLE